MTVASTNMHPLVVSLSADGWRRKMLRIIQRHGSLAPRRLCQGAGAIRGTDRTFPVSHVHPARHLLTDGRFACWRLLIPGRGRYRQRVFCVDAISPSAEIHTLLVCVTIAQHALNGGQGKPACLRYPGLRIAAAGHTLSEQGILPQAADQGRQQTEFPGAHGNGAASAARRFANPLERTGAPR
jgi:hypothetical protein